MISLAKKTTIAAFVSMIALALSASPAFATEAIVDFTSTLSSTDAGVTPTSSPPSRLRKPVMGRRRERRVQRPGGHFRQSEGDRPLHLLRFHADSVSLHHPRRG